MAERHIKINVEVVGTNLQVLAQLNTLLQHLAARQADLAKATTVANKALLAQRNVILAQTNGLIQYNKAIAKNTLSIASNILKVIAWSAATMAVYGSFRLLFKALEDVGNVEYALAGVEKVMNQTSDAARVNKATIRELGKEIRALAIRFGELGSDAIEATTEWARTQQSVRSITEGVRASLLAQAVAEMSVADATGYLISALQQFERPASQAVAIIDSWNKLSNIYAVRAVDMAQAVAKAGSVFYTLGMSIEQLNAMTAILVASTKKSGSEIGNALKTLGVYAYRVETVNKLKEYGIDIIDRETGRVKNYMAIIGELSAKWDTYTEAQQRSIANTMAGARRITEFLLLVEKFPQILEATIEAYDSQGSALRELEIYMDTVKKRSDRFRSSAENLAFSLGEILLPMTKRFIDVLTYMMIGLAEAKVLFVALSIAVTGLIATFLKLKRIFEGMVALFLKLKPVTLAIYGTLLLLTTITSVYVGLLGRRISKERELQQLQRDQVLTESKNVQLQRAKLDYIRELIRHYEQLGIVLQSKALTEPERVTIRQRRVNLLQRLRTFGAPVPAGEEMTDETMATIREWLDVRERSWGVYYESTIERLERILAERQKRLDLLERVASAVTSYARGRNYTDRVKGFGRQLRLIANMFPDINAMQIIREAAVVEDVLGRPRTDDQLVISLQKLSEATKRAREDVQTVMQEIQTMAVKPPVLEGELSVEERRDILTSIRQHLERINAAYRHQADLISLKKRTEEEAARVTIAGLTESIAVLQQYINLYSYDIDLVEELTETMGEYQLQLELAKKYTLDFAKTSDLITKLQNEYENTVATINEVTAAEVDYYNALGDVDRAYERERQGLIELIQVTEGFLAQLNELGVNTRDQSTVVGQLDRELANLDRRYRDIIKPVRDLDRVIDQLNDDLEYQQTLMETQGRRRSELMQQELATVKRQIEAYEKLPSTLLQDNQAYRSLLQRRRILELTLPVTLREERFTEWQRGAEARLETMLLRRQWQPRADVEEARQRLLHARRAFRVATGLGYRGEQLTPLLSAIQQATLQHQQALLEEGFEQRQKEFARLRSTLENYVSYLQAVGVDEEGVFRARLEQLQTLREANDNFFKEYQTEWERNNDELLDDERELTNDLIRLHRERAEAIVSAYFNELARFEERWADAFAQVLRGDFGGIGDVLEEITTSALTASLQQNPLIQQLAKYSVQKSGFQEMVQREEERRREFVQQLDNTFVKGSTTFSNTFLEAGEIVANMISVAIQGKEVKREEKKEKEKVSQTTEPVPVSVQSVSKAVKGELITPMMPNMDLFSRFMASFNLFFRQVDRDRITRGGGARAIADILAYNIGLSLEEHIPQRFGPQWRGIGSVLQKGAMESVVAYQADRGGAAIGRVVGMGLGAIVGSLVSQPAFGAALGQEIGAVVGAELSKATTKPYRPQEEALRDVLATTIAQGQFQAAANITYHVQNTATLNYIIPDAEQTRRIMEWLKKAWREHNTNVDVGG